MPLPWLIGVAAVAAVTAIVKAVSDDSPSSSSSSSRSADSERRKQEQAAKKERERQGLKDRVSNLEKDRREQLKVQVKNAVQALGKTSVPITAVMTVNVASAAWATLGQVGAHPLFGQSTSEMERAISSKQSSSSGYGEAMRLFLHASPILSAEKSKRFLEDLNVLEKLTSAINTEVADQQVLAQLKISAARIERLQRLKSEVEQQA
ncbi:hypothetical protein PS838_02827 [Pseudomonas fluorescens]|nr:hypothetical protein PS838_02827 [Pseudomonas fluorescens]